MDHEDPGNVGYPGVLATIVTGGMALLGIFLASDRLPWKLRW